MNEIKVAVLDIDGTLCPGTLGIEILGKMVDAGVCNRERADGVLDVLRRYQVGAIAFPAMATAAHQLFAQAIEGIPCSVFEEVAREVWDEQRSNLFPFVRPLLATLRQAGYWIALISGSPQEIVQLVADELAIPLSSGSVCGREDGRYTGQVDVSAGAIGEKARILARLTRGRAVCNNESLAVGDSLADASLFEQMGLPLAFEPDPALMALARERGWTVVTRNDVLERIHSLCRLTGEPPIDPEIRPKRRSSADKGCPPSPYAYLQGGSEDGLFRCGISVSRTGGDCLPPAPPEIFSSLVVLRTALRRRTDLPATQRVLRACVEQARRGVMNFFVGGDCLFPDDADTTAYGLSTLIEMGAIRPEGAEVVAAVRRVAANVDPSGVMQVYFDPERFGKTNRVDPAALCNMLGLFLCTGGDLGSAEGSLQLVEQALRSGEYLKGSRYYPSPDSVLYLLSGMAAHPQIGQRFSGLLAECLRRRMGSTDYPLDLAMRVTAARNLGVDNGAERRKLADMMDRNGSWPADGLFSYGGKAGCFVSPYLSTALAIEALDLYE